MRVAFYTAPGNRLDAAVRKWTKGPYSHCELVFSPGIWFSASPRDGGTRFKLITASNGTWDFVELQLTAAQEQAVYDFCLAEDDCWYDWVGIMFSQIAPLSFENPWWWFCSELCVAALQQAALLQGVIPHETDPNDLYELLNNARCNLDERIEMTV